MSISSLVVSTIDNHNMIKKGDKVLAAVSGGADSVFMLHILNRLKSDLKFSLICAHVNHGLRGDAADRDERFVKDLCKELEIPFFCGRFDVKKIADEEKLTVEEAGRKVRYSFFEELKKEHKIDKIATAHNKNDNAETVLMRIIRGTGIDGLRGISYVREDGVVRPILDVSRKEIEEYCKANNLSFCTDQTNLDNNYTRNKIRNELLPYLEKEFNGMITDSLVRLSKGADEDSRFINGYAKRLFQRLKSPIKGPNVLHIDSLKMVEKSVAVRIIKLAIEESEKGVKLEKRHIDDIFEIMEKQTGTSIDLPKGLKVTVNYGWLTFEGSLDRKKVAAKNDGFFIETAVGETVFLEGVGKQISLREESGNYKCKINEIKVDLDKIKGPLFLRSRQDGDRMVWFPDGREKKIKSIFIDEKIPQKDRNKIPLLTTGNEIIAIVGSRVSEKYKLTKETERALVIEYGLYEE